MFFLHCADFFPHLEEHLRRLVREAPRPETLPSGRLLIVVPTTAIRKRILTTFAIKQPDALNAIEIFSINQLAIKIVLDASAKPKNLISDPLFFPYSLYQLALAKNIERFSNFRTCLALYQTLRDLGDGAVTAQLLTQVIQDSRRDPDLDFPMKISDATSLSTIYTQLDEFVNQHQILNLQMPTAAAADLAQDWMQRKNPSELILYGFYDSTETQFELLEKLIRFMHRNDRRSHFLFPFRVSWNNQVEHPAGFAQPFFERLFSLSSALNGPMDVSENTQRLASGGVESVLFAGPNDSEVESIRNSSNIEFFHAGGIYDEIWAIAKRILNLVRKDNVRFDQILVITRSLEDYAIPLTHIFGENKIPCSITRQDTLASLPFGRFAYSLVTARLSRLSNASLFELLSSPFLHPPSIRDFQNLDAIFSGLVIRNCSDWERLTPLLENVELPLIFEFIKPDELDSFRNTVRYLWELKSRILKIPDRATLPDFARGLRLALESICRLTEGNECEPFFELLDQIADYSMLRQREIALSEFADLLKFYLQRTHYHRDEKQPAAAVMVGDIMQLRGLTADYVFVAGLNNDVFPRRALEDPFLPDRARKSLREIAGAGPAAKRSNKRLLPDKEETSEELLLFSLALRSAEKQLFLSYQRADDLGRKRSASGYLDEVVRILTGKTCDGNEHITSVAKFHEAKFIQDDVFNADVLPAPAECATLTSHFSVKQIASHFYELASSYVEHLAQFAGKMNSLQRNEASEQDGCISDPSQFWAGLLNGKNEFRISYSQFKHYLECPFKFYATTILGLTESPKDSEDEEHDVSQLMKGLISEDVVKRALRYIRDQKLKKDQALAQAVTEVAQKYASIFPPVLLNFYLKIFHKGASNLINYLLEQGFDLSKTEVPERAQGGEVELLRSENPEFGVVIKGIPDFIFYKSNGDGMIVDLKWRTKHVANTLSYIFQKGEAQFCIYPAVVEARTGMFFPFRYSRLDAYAAYESPSKILQRIDLSESEAAVVLRTFGGAGNVEECGSYFAGQIRQKATQMLEGNFRIVDDPSPHYSVCRYCDFTQICRRSHTATLLRSKQTETQ